MVFKAKSLILILITFGASLSDTVFLTISFLTTSLNLLKLTGTGANLSMSNLSTSVFGLTKFVFSAKLEESMCLIFCRSVYVGYLERSTLILIFPPKLLNGLGKY